MAAMCAGLFFIFVRLSKRFPAKQPTGSFWEEPVKSGGSATRYDAPR